MYLVCKFPLNNEVNALKAKEENLEMGGLLNTITAFSKKSINHEKSFLQTLTHFFFLF